MKFLQIIGLVLFLALVAGGVQAETYGVKRFACMEMRWSIPTGSTTANVEIVKDQEPFGRLSLSPQEPFRQFNFSTDAIIAEGRIRLRIDETRNKGILKLDSFSYRCYSPVDQFFSGPLEEFDLPQKP